MKTARYCEKPSEQERATEQEKTTAFERAKIAEKTIEEERATPEEKTIEEERATPDEKTNVRERATEQEKTRVEERATTVEKTMWEERAKAEEKTTAVERAMETEKTIGQERAIDCEKPMVVERAKTAEEPKSEKRILSDPIRQSLSVLVRAYYDYQRERMGLDGRLGQKKDGEIKKGIPERDDSMLAFLLERREACMAMEEGLFKDIAKEVKTHPLWKNFLKGVKGCGESVAAVIITEFDINKATTVSNLWSFSGLAPGKDRKVKGQKCPYNQFLRAKLCGVLGSSFLKCNSPYRVYYDDMKLRLESKDWGMASKNPTDKNRPKAGHQHKAATRYMIKMFLKDLYVAWRTLEGLPVREPYQEQYLGHRHVS